MKRTPQRIYMYVRRRAIYFVLGFCILAIALSIVFMLVNKQNKNSIDVEDVPVIEKPEDSTPEQPEQPVVTQVTFIMPVKNYIDVSEYSETMVWNGTLGRYSSHKAIDFFAQEGADVFAVYDGTIASVQTTLLQGTTIVVDHGNGLFTKYNSLADGDSVVVGQTVKQGDVIGQVSLTNRQEQANGAHVHFEVLENGINVDPSKYLEFSEK